MERVGILAIGRYLPDEVRRNDYWPKSIVDRWIADKERNISRADRKAAADMPPGLRRTLEALNELQRDPFQGAVERRVMAEHQRVSDMEAAAAEEAIERAGVRKQDIDFLLGYSICPEFINVPTACETHHKVGLRPDCFSFNTDAVCNSFATQLTVAESLIKSGRFKLGLLTQSSGITRLAPAEDSFSLFAGDGATAVVVGRVSGDRGLLAYGHRTDGALAHALVATVPGKHWYDEGRVLPVTVDPAAGRDMLFGVADRGREVVHAALARAEATPADVDFYASHQATKWFRSVTQQHFELGHAKSVDTFPFAGTLSGANLPLVMYTAKERGLLDDGDLIATYSGGTGMTYSSLVLRWGA